MKVTVCWKWVAVDGAAPDDRWSGVSGADEAALEVALLLTGDDDEVVVVCAGPPASEAALRNALAVGASRAVRIDADGADSYDVATALAEVAADSEFVVCGDYSLDRGTGSVPAFLALRLGAAQALGLVEVDARARPVRVIRRLGGGRREVLDVPSPAVLSVEGAAATLRRASLAAAVSTTSASIDVLPGPRSAASDVLITNYRPRARALPAPAGGTLSRVRDILDIDAAEAGHSETVTLEPSAAAARIVDQLREWGYLPHSD